MCLPALSRTVLSDPPHTFHKSSHFASVLVVVAAGRGRSLIVWAHLCGSEARGRWMRTVRLARRSASARGRCCAGRRRCTAAAEHPGPPCKARHWLVCPCPIAPVAAGVVDSIQFNSTRRSAMASCRSRGQTARVTVDNRATSGGRQDAKHRRTRQYCDWDRVLSKVAHGRLRGEFEGGGAAKGWRVLGRR
jgi:hypothetical protein